MRKFAQIPFSFRGLGEERGLFNLIGSENAQLLHPTVKKGEEIFAQVWALKENYADWVLPLQVDCEKIFMELGSTREFEDALRSVKKRGKDLERLAPEVRIGRGRHSGSRSHHNPEIICFQSLILNFPNSIQIPNPVFSKLNPNIEFFKINHKSQSRILKIPNADL